MEHENWLTALFNEHLAGVANSVLGLVHLPPKDPQHPWQTWAVMEIVVVLLLVILTAVLRSRLSVDNPGKTQHIFESVYAFLKNLAQDAGVHHPEEYLPYFATLALFILSMNLFGIIPAFESPTMSPAVTAGLAICTFFYYNYLGFHHNGVKYLAHFAGPVWWLAPLMIPIELISHLARPLSLSIRLYGNIFAGEQVTNVFLSLTYLVMPAVFMALHVFVSFIQAYVFTLLAMVYVSGATAHEH